VKLAELGKRPFVFLTPLNRWSAATGTITGAFSIKQLDDTLLDLNSWAYFLSPHELEALKGFEQWLWYEFDGDFPRNVHAEAAELDRFDYALDAVQILAPTGSHGLVLMARRESNGKLTLESGHHRLHRREPIYGRITELSKGATVDLAVLIQKVDDAFCRSLIRIKNPVRFLQHGLQANEMHIRLLLFTTGLDGLLMAGGRSEFCSRLQNLLGRDTFVFPPDSLHHQPKYTVADIAGDLYDLRSEIAHGRSISSRFRELTDLLDKSGNKISTAFRQYRYRHVLEEGSVFLLCQALTKVLTTDLLNDIPRQKEWRERLKYPV
jgi:hypothetical protein